MSETASQVLSPLDYTEWPIVKFRMPDRVPDEAAEAQVAEFEGLLAKNERFVLVFHGPFLPKKSKHFMKLYGAWAKRTRPIQKQLCAGAIRVEPNEELRKSFVTMALTYVNRVAVPYPYKTVADDDAARRLAESWLGSG